MLHLSTAGSPVPTVEPMGAWLEDKGTGLHMEPSPSPSLTPPAHTPCPAAKYRSIRRGFKGSHHSPNRRVNIFGRSPCCFTHPPTPPPLKHAIPVTQATLASPRLGAKLTVPSHMGKVAKAEPCRGAEAPSVIAPQLSL